LLRSATWLLIYWTKYHALQFVIVLTRLLNCALEYTLDRVRQVTDSSAVKNQKIASTAQRSLTARVRIVKDVTLADWSTVERKSCVQKCGQNYRITVPYKSFSVPLTRLILLLLVKSCLCLYVCLCVCVCVLTMVTQMITAARNPVWGNGLFRIFRRLL